MEHESLQVKTIKTVFGGLDNDQKLSLVKDLFNDTQVNVRDILLLNDFLAYMVIHHPDHISIWYDEPGTEGYQAITTWCNIEKDLVEFHFFRETLNEQAARLASNRFLLTRNHVLYDKVTKSFIHEAFKFKTINFSYDAIVPKIISDTIDTNISLYYESDFPKNSLKTLEEIGAIGPQIKISSLLIEEY